MYSCRTGGLNVVGGSPGTIGTGVAVAAACFRGSLIEPVVSGGGCICACASFFCSACAFSMRSIASMILALCWLASAVVVFTGVFMVQMLLFSVLVQARRRASL